MQKGKNMANYELNITFHVVCLFFLWTDQISRPPLSCNKGKNGSIKQYWRYATINSPFSVTWTILMFTCVIIRLNVNTLTIRIDVSTFNVMQIRHQMHTKPHGNNDKMLTPSGRCLLPSRMESCGGESEAVSHLKSLETSIQGAFVVPKQEGVR